MITVNRSLLATAVLSVLSTGVNAKIYPDQIVYDYLGVGACRSDYRPIDRYEAEEHKSALVALMGPWQVTGLKDNWVIMGSGHYGEIKQEETVTQRSVIQTMNHLRSQTILLNRFRKVAKSMFNMRW